MLGLFTDFYPDELLYSTLSRLFQALRYQSPTHLIQELYGTSSIRPAIEFPRRLNQLLAALPDGHGYDADYILNQHTLLPFYSPFQEPSRVSTLREAMLGGGGNLTYQNFGKAHPIPNLKFLRYCPVCIDEDRCQVGEAYWHRSHQIMGIDVCAKHGVWLEDSDVYVTGIDHFATLEQQVTAIEAQSLDEGNPAHQIIHEIACDAVWLLSQPNLLFEPESLRQRYYIALQDRGLSPYTGQNKRLQDIQQQFTDFYGTELLEQLHCGLGPNSKINWLIRLIRKEVRASFPLYHLLFMKFLGLTAAEFFQLSPERKLFGDPNWPCLNPVSDHYHELCIDHFELKYSQLRDKRPIGTFACPRCGYTYSRTGPDRSYDDRFKTDFTVKVVAYGPWWDELLVKRWYDTAFSVKRTALEMKVGEGTVQRQARRLGLPLPKPGSYTSKDSDQSPSEVMSQTTEAQRDEYRAKYLATVKEHGYQGSGFVHGLIPREHNWLIKHDHGWLKEHRPAKKQPIRLRTRKSNRAGRDWPAIDAELSSQVVATADELKDAPGGRTRITVKAIGKRLGQVAALEKSLHHLPLTDAALNEVIETPEEYAVRRVQRCEQEFRHAGCCPTRATIIDRAGIRYEMAERLIVNQAIDSVIEELGDKHA